MLVIGITGTLGAGKGTVVDYLATEKKFGHYSVRDFINKEIVKRGLEINRDNMVVVANDLRLKHGPSYLIEQIYKTAIKTGKNFIIESLRTPAEIYSLKSKGEFVLFAVDADIEKRYKRINKRAIESDHVSFEKFVVDEKREMKSQNPAKQNLAKCISLADYIFTNNKKIVDLHEQVEKTIKNII